MSVFLRLMSDDDSYSDKNILTESENNMVIFNNLYNIFKFNLTSLLLSQIKSLKFFYQYYCTKSIDIHKMTCEAE